MYFYVYIFARLHFCLKLYLVYCLLKIGKCSNEQKKISYSFESIKNCPSLLSQDNFCIIKYILCTYITLFVIVCQNQTVCFIKLQQCYLFKPKGCVLILFVFFRSSKTFADILNTSCFKDILNMNWVIIIPMMSLSSVMDCQIVFSLLVPLVFLV